MSPCLKHGDYILVKKTKPPIAAGTVVVARHATLGEIIKRVKSVDEFGRFLLEGDSSQSSSSRAIGLIYSEKILAVVAFRVGRFKLITVSTKHPT